MPTISAGGPWASDADELTVLLRAFRSMQLQHGRVIAHESVVLGLGPTDIRALFFLSEADDHGTPKQVSEFLELTTGATTSLVDRLVAGGTVERAAHPTDRRSLVLSLTPAGHQVVGAVANVYRDAVGEAVEGTSLAELTLVFQSIADALAKRNGQEPA